MQRDQDKCFYGDDPKVAHRPFAHIPRQHLSAREAEKYTLFWTTRYPAKLWVPQRRKEEWVNEVW